MIPSYRCIHNYPSVDDTTFLKGRGMLSPKWWDIPPYIVAHYPLYGGVLHIIDVVLSPLVGLLVVIVHLFLLYIWRRYFHFRKHCIWSCLGYKSTLCKEVLPSKRIFVYLCYSLWKWVFNIKIVEIDQKRVIHALIMNNRDK